MKRRQAEAAPDKGRGIPPRELLDHDSPVWHDHELFIAWVRTHLTGRRGVLMQRCAADRNSIWVRRFGEAAREWAKHDGVTCDAFGLRPDWDRLVELGVHPYTPTQYDAAVAEAKRNGKWWK